MAKKKNEVQVKYEALAKKFPAEPVDMEDCPLAVQEYGNRHDTEVTKVGQLFVLVQVDPDPMSPRDWDNAGTIIATPDRERYAFLRDAAVAAAKNMWASMREPGRKED